ncbi:MAG: hypothetical protein AB1733_20885 [Thermodesulfobacteriota bacterium]
MKRVGITVTVGAFLASAMMGISDFAEAQGNKSNIVGPAPLTMHTRSSNPNVVKIDKKAIQNAQYRGVSRVTPIPIPRPR